MSAELIVFLRARYDEDDDRARSGYYSETHWERFTTSASLKAWQAWRIYYPRERWDVAANDAITNAAKDAIRERITAHEANRTARALREVEAKRRILAVHHPYVDEPDQACLGCAGGIEWERCPVLRALAAVYADHPHYRQEWRP